MKKQNEHIANIQNQIGYNFNNTDLMFQAFVRKSYSEENGGTNNEILEFIGDKVLDLIVVKLLTEKYGKIETAKTAIYDSLDAFTCKLDEGKLSEEKRKLVEKKNLANKMLDLGFQDYLIMSKGDIKNEVQYSFSAMEDLFEAIIGAVAIDSNWNIKEIQSVVEYMLDFDNYSDDNENYIDLLQNWSLKRYSELPYVRVKKLDRYESPNSLIHKSNEIVAKWQHKGIINIDDVKKCIILLPDINFEFIGYGYSGSDARKSASKLAYEWLEENNLLLTIKDEIDNPNKDEAINQLEILARRGYFSLPEYDFKQNYDKYGNPVWTCNCSIKECKKTFSSKSSSKKDAKKSCAFKMLKYVLEVM